MVNIKDLIGPLQEPIIPELRCVLVSTLHGSTTVNGTSGDLGNNTDTALLLGLRQWSDVVLVGSGTIKAENYGGVQIPLEIQQQRLTNGQRAIPPIAVISSSLKFDVESRFFKEAQTRPLIFTDNKDAELKAVLKNAGAEIIEMEVLSVRGVVDKLRDAGYARITCEGGATLYAQVLDAGLVDIWHQTVDPTISGTVEHPMVQGGNAAPQRFRFDHFYADADSTVFLRYVRS
ncbi:pyrimidine reductase family protein [Corynebacterium callunae]|uniref:pyrimidine reductase family protein n=1 Tax=Corynebacterium callunae TaxID=1721 RepID=UPI001FFE8552|nr:pyrimidine reductase family protein [Corynebacterium callunae]MCK2200335.1 pyrimidine reductase family protein [Corynebacterium callunae]